MFGISVRGLRLKNNDAADNVPDIGAVLRANNANWTSSPALTAFFNVRFTV